MGKSNFPQQPTIEEYNYYVEIFKKFSTELGRAIKYNELKEYKLNEWQMVQNIVNKSYNFNNLLNLNRYRLQVIIRRCIKYTFRITR